MGQGTDRTGDSAVTGRALAGLMIVFFLALLPISVGFNTYHGDERFYTDGTLQMMQRGDYLTPAYADGSLRFNKPILTYWVLAASYKALGINPFSSRVASLIAGCLVICLTYRIALSLFAHRATAWLAALLVFSNVQVATAALRSTPDIFQCLFVAVSLYGLVEIIFAGRRTLLSLLCAYVGAALAVETKGLTGLLPVAFAFAFCALYALPRTRPRDLVHVPVMIVGMAVAVAWFAVVYAKYGAAAIHGFLNDQVGERIPNRAGLVASNVLEYTVGVFRLFLPWTALLILLMPRSMDRVRRLAAEHRAAFVFCTAWYLVLFVIFSAANIQRTRYFLPAYPLLAAMFAAALASLVDGARGFRILSVTAAVLGAVAAVGGLLLAGAGVMASGNLILAGGIVLAAGAGLFAAARRVTGAAPLLTALAVVTLLGFSVTHLLIRTVLPASPTPVLAQRIAAGWPDTGWVQTMGFPLKYDGQLRVLLGGRVTVEPVVENAAMTQGEARLLVVAAEKMANVNLGRYHVVAAVPSFGDVNFSKIRKAFLARDRATALADAAATYYLVALSKPLASEGVAHGHQ